MNTHGREWMYKRWLGGGMFNPDYERGVEMFLDFTFSSMGNISYSDYFVHVSDVEIGSV